MVQFHSHLNLLLFEYKVFALQVFYKVFSISVLIKKNRINNDIIATTLRLIDENGNQMGIKTLSFALSMALDCGLDLVEIQPNTIPPVAKIMDYGKFLFKKEKLNKKKQSFIRLKEIKFRPTTDKNDYTLKLRNLCNFLKSGNKVKISIWFRGREILHKELGKILMDNIESDLKDFGKIEALPKSEGRTIVAVFTPLNLKE